MKNRLTQWCIDHGAGDAAARHIESEVIDRYEEAHRHYHNLAHIERSLELADQVGKAGGMLEGAIWFHDVIYNPESHQNEADSVRFFEKVSNNWIDDATRREVAHLILVTAPMHEEKLEPLSELMIDIDLAVLASSEQDYEAYRRQIRKEYEHVADRAFNEGRSKILKGILKERIYRSPMFAHLERQARKNIAHELSELER